MWATDGYCTKVAYGATGGGGPYTSEMPQSECTISASDIGTLIPIPLTQADFLARGLDPRNGRLNGNNVVWVNGQAMMTGTNMAVLSNADLPELVNGIFSARMQVGQNRDGVGMVFRATSDSSGGMRGYSFQIDPGLRNQFALYEWARVPGQTRSEESRLRTVPFPPGFDPRAANDMRIEVNGNQMRVFANNGTDPVFEYTLPANGPMGSLYGFRNWGGDNSTMTPNIASNMSITQMSN